MADEAEGQPSSAASSGASVSRICSAPVGQFATVVRSRASNASSSARPGLIHGRFAVSKTSGTPHHGGSPLNKSTVALQSAHRGGGGGGAIGGMGLTLARASAYGGIVPTQKALAQESETGRILGHVAATG